MTEQEQVEFRQKWKKWIDKIEQDLGDLLISQDTFKEVAQIVASNKQIQSSPFFFTWIQNNYMDYLFNASQEDEEGNQKGYGPTMAGFMNDWLYLGLGIHSILPEMSGATEDYDGDGYLTAAEMARWKEEVGKQWFSPWTPYDHPILGEVEIGGSWGTPRVYGPRGKYDSEILYDWHLYMADISPLLKIEDVQSEPITGGKYPGEQ